MELSESKPTQSQEIGELADALAKAQAEFPLLERTKTVRVKTRGGGEYTFSYAPLDVLIEAVRKPLSTNGLAFVQLFDGPAVVTRLLHASGQWIESRIVIQPIADDSGVTPQAVGSAITYARRYSLSALLGLADETDDDGNVASGNAAHEEAAKTCPSCGRSGTIIRGKAEYGGGWVCWKTKGGCGAKLQDVDFEPAPEKPSASKQPMSQIDLLRQYLHKTLGCSNSDEASHICWFVSGGTYETIEAATATNEDASAVMNAIADSIAEAKCKPTDLLRKALLEHEMQQALNKEKSDG